MSKMTLPRDKHGIADFGDRHWQDFGECLDYDPELMFPSDKKPEQVEEALGGAARRLLPGYERRRMSVSVK